MLPKYGGPGGHQRIDTTRIGKAAKQDFPDQSTGEAQAEGFEIIMGEESGAKLPVNQTTVVDIEVPKQQKEVNVVVPSKDGSLPSSGHYTFNITGDNVRIQIGAADTVQEATDSKRVKETYTQLKRLIEEAVEDRKKAAESRKVSEECMKRAREMSQSIDSQMNKAMEKLKKVKMDRKKAEQLLDEAMELKREAEEEAGKDRRKAAKDRRDAKEYKRQAMEDRKAAAEEKRKTEKELAEKRKSAVEDAELVEEPLQKETGKLRIIMKKEQVDGKELGHVAKEVREDRSLYARKEDTEKEDEEVVDRSEDDSSEDWESEDSADAVDPNFVMPVRPAFVFFMQEYREKALKSGMRVVGVDRAGGREWQENTPDRSKWEKMAAADRKRYRNEK